MKRIGNLYEKIISLENLQLAESKARKGKLKTRGVHYFDSHQPEKLLQDLHETLKNHQYHTSHYKVFTIHTPKERLIYKLPYYPDRIVHHAIMNILEPIWVSVFPYNTYSCIPGRGIEGARKQVIKIISDRSYRYCLKVDIRKFYPSVQHEVIKSIYRKKIKCPETLALLDEIVDSVNGCPDPLNLKQTCQGRSIPIGNYLSQYLANLTLAYTLHKINKQFPQVKGVVYADDGCYFAKNKEILHQLLEFIKQELTQLGLELKPNYQIFPIAQSKFYPKKNMGDKHGRGVDFLGYVFFTKHTNLRKSIKYNLRRKIRQLPDDLNSTQFKKEICSWLGWAKHSDSKHLLKNIVPECHYSTIEPIITKTTTKNINLPDI